MGRRSNYSAGLYKQFEEVMSRLSQLESAHKEDSTALKQLNHNLGVQAAEIRRLTDETTEQKNTIQVLQAENTALKKENQLLKDDNERMKRILNNNSNNSSLPPSSDKAKTATQAVDTRKNDEETEDVPGKPANKYNGRTRSGRKKGAQPGHDGTTATREAVEQKIRNGEFVHRLLHIGKRSGSYVTRYVLDLDIKVTATEVHIYADPDGKYRIPAAYRSQVTYGPNVRAMAACLYSEGVMSNDRICAFINSVSGDRLEMSEGTVYSICRQFSVLCKEEENAITADLLNSHVLCTDATHMTQDGMRAYIRNISSPHSVIYRATETKGLEALRTIKELTGFTGIFEHDHETALYHFGTGHAECNVHLERYLQKNTEETGNNWSRDLAMFLKGMNHARKVQMAAGSCGFDVKELSRYESRYDQILETGEAQHQRTKGRIARQEERKLLNRVKRYKENHLLFLHNFEVPYSDNMSERDLRKCKNRQKMSGGFRSMKGMGMYCSIMSVIETVKRRGLNIYHSISKLFEGRSVIA